MHTDAIVCHKSLCSREDFFGGAVIQLSCGGLTLVVPDAHQKEKGNHLSSHLSEPGHNRFMTGGGDCRVQLADGNGVQYLFTSMIVPKGAPRHSLQSAYTKL